MLLSRTWSPLLLVLALPAVARGQVLTGSVVDAGTRDPVVAAMITVTDTAGRFVAGAWSSDAGRFSIPVGASGTFIVLVERIGFETHHTRATIPSETELLILLPAAAVQLVGIEVGAERQCRIAEEEGSILAQVWNEARKNLRASLRPGMTLRLRLTSRRSDRLLALRTLDVQRVSYEGSPDGARSPFMASPAQDLVQYGYVRQGTEGAVHYFGPSAETLLDPSFEQTHCFSLAEGAPNEIGLAFEPRSDRTLPDIAGVMWFERATARLLRIEYSFTDHVLPFAIPEGVFGGETQFRHMANGDVIVDRWWIRMPEFQRPVRINELPASVAQGYGFRRLSSRDLAQLALAGLMVREAGGEILSATVRGRSGVAHRTRSRVARSRVPASAPRSHIATAR